MERKWFPAGSRRRVPAGRDPRVRAGDHTTLSKASQPPLQALTYLLHLVMVELREEVGEQMRGDHPVAARRRRVGKPRLERVRGRRTARSDRFVSGLGGPAGNSESGRHKKKAMARPARKSRVSVNRFGES